LIQAKVAAVRGEREKAIARRKDALTGTSEFPDLAELPATVLETAPTSPSASSAALPCRRLAEPFEALRDAADRMLEKTGARPKILLANLGRLADFTPRASYARNFFEAGGIEAVTSDGFASHEEMLVALKTCGAGLACLCSSDEVYAREAIETVTTLRAAGAKHIYLAGRPGELETALRAAGVGTFIYVGCDVVATLATAQAMLSHGAN
jgi:methylmalonyl-CoA mutase